MATTDRRRGGEQVQDTEKETSDSRGPSRGRAIAFRVVDGVFALAAFGGLFGIGIVIGWFSNDEGGIHRVHEIGFGVLYGILLTSACVALLWRTDRRPSAFWQIVAVGAASVLGGALGTSFQIAMLGAFVLVGAGILFALHPARSSVLHPGFAPSPLLGALVVLGSVPLVALALAAAKLQRTGLPTDPHVQQGHWSLMASMALGLVLCGLLAAARGRGWRLTAWCAGLGVAVYGLASVVFANFQGTGVRYAGSEGVGWGIAAIIGGLLFVAASEWVARSTPERRVASA